MGKKSAYAGQTYDASPLASEIVEPDHGFDVAAGSAADGTVEISYTLPENAENVFVGLWNKFAFHIRTLVSEESQTRGRRTVVWDGKDDQGNPAGPGVYILRMCTAGEKGTSRMVEWVGAS